MGADSKKNWRKFHIAAKFGKFWFVKPLKRTRKNRIGKMIVIKNMGYS